MFFLSDFSKTKDLHESKLDNTLSGMGTNLFGMYQKCTMYFVWSFLGKIVAFDQCRLGDIQNKCVVMVKEILKIDWVSK